MIHYGMTCAHCGRFVGVARSHPFGFAIYAHWKLDALGRLVCTRPLCRLWRKVLP